MTDAPCIFCGKTTPPMELRNGRHVHACRDCVKPHAHSVPHEGPGYFEFTTVLSTHGAMHIMNRIEAFEARLPDDPEDGKDCDGEFVDLPNPHEEIRQQRDALHREVQQLKHINHQLVKALECDEKTRASLEATAARLTRWRNAPRIEIKAIGHKHDGLYARVPEGER